MPVKERLSGVSLDTLVPVKTKPIRLTIQEEIVSSKPFVIPKRNFKQAVFAGRQRELDYLKSFYSETLTRIKKQNNGTEETSKPYVIGIKGEAGMGKSRLVREFHARISSALSNCRFISGGSYSSGQNPYGLISELLKNSLSISEDTHADKVQGIITESSPELSKENITHLTKIICGVSSTENSIAVKNALKEYLFSLCYYMNQQNLPLVLVLEDMQWADEPSLETIEHIVRSLNLFTDKKQPQMLFIMNYRAGFKPSKALRTESEYKELILEGLSENETTELAARINGGKKISPKTIEIIIRRSDGNPFNIEEWCRLFSEDRKTKTVPATVKSLLAERVSALEPGERAVLIAASVLGRKFELRIVNEILKSAEKHEPTENIMQSLVEKKYLVNLTGDIYEFRHDLLQETIYRYLNTGTRRNVHLLAGKAIESLYPGNLSNYYYELARHYTEAKDDLKSAHYLEKAGDKAKDNYEHNRAIRHYSKLLKKCSAEKKYDITFKLCDVYMNRSEWNKQIELCKNILAESLRLDKNIKAECYKRIGHAYRLKGDYKDARNIYKKAYRIYEEKHDVQGKLDIMEREAKVMMVMGKYKESLASFEMIYKIAKEKGFNELYKNALIGLGVVNSKIASYDNTIKYNEELIKYCIKLGDKTGILSGKINKAEAHYYLGEYKVALSIYTKARLLAQKFNRRQDVASCLGNLGILSMIQKKYTAAFKLFQEQRQIYFELGDVSGVARSLGLIGANLISCKEYRNAMPYFVKQRIIYKKQNNKNSEAICLGNIGLIYFNVGNYKSAKELYLRQLKIDKKNKNLDGILRAYLNLGILFKKINKTAISKSYFTKVISLSINNLANSYLKIAIDELSTI
jgi:tetratricopeptide (TPR) repeat protein